MRTSSPAQPPLTGTRVLVSGASGYLASRLMPRLAAAGAQLLAQTRHPEAVAAAQVDAAAHARGGDGVDGADPDRPGGGPPGPERTLLVGAPGQADVDAAIRDFAPEIVFGLAGRTDSRQGEENRRTMQVEHVDYADRLADAVAGPALRRLVCTGSCAEYGSAPVPFDEAHPVRPQDPYAQAKTDAVVLLRRRAEAEDLPLVVVRPFVVYGPGQKRGVVAFALRQALADAAFDTTEGTQTRDFVWVDDVVDGLLAAATAPDAVGGIYNLGTGIETPVRTLIEMVCRLVGGGRPRFGAIPLPPGDLLRSVAAVDRAREALGWQAAVPLADGLRRVVEAAREEA
jgi:UDP-glucose 4-epimerase